MTIFSKTVQNCSYPFDSFVTPFVFALIALSVLFLFYFVSQQFVFTLYGNISRYLVLLGGLYNILPRLFGLCVSDYLKFFIWYINIGDILVVVGIIGVAFSIWINKLK